MTKIITVVPARWSVSDSLEATVNGEFMVAEDWEKRWLSIGYRKDRTSVRHDDWMGSAMHPSGHADPIRFGTQWVSTCVVRTQITLREPVQPVRRLRRLADVENKARDSPVRELGAVIRMGKNPARSV